ncbi:MAG: hypothetical protein GXY06_04210 [Clostridiaceae bacterium]|nr:hypothetical protein [Clostridiaceae bacterium]
MKKELFNLNARKLVVLVLSIALIVGIAGCKKKVEEVEVDLNEYIDLTIEGRDGDGEAYFVFDYESLIEDLLDHEDLGEFFDDEEDDLTELFEEMTIELSSTYDLSNGDVLTYEVEYDEDDAEDLKLVILDLEDVTVEGLAVPQDYNAFDDLTVSFSGISPFIEVDMEYNSSLDTAFWASFSTDKEYYAKGEPVTITMDYDDYDAEYAFVNITETEMEVTAECEYEYILDVSQITDKTEMFDYIYAEVQDYVTAELSKDAQSIFYGMNLHDNYDYSSKTNIAQLGGNIEVDSVYFLTKKETQLLSYDTVNELAIIFKVPVIFQEIDADTIYYAYMYALLPDVKLDAEGNIFVAYSDLKVKDVYSRDRVETYDKLVTENVDKFDVAEIPVADIPAFPSASTETVPTETVPSETVAGETTVAEESTVEETTSEE